VKERFEGKVSDKKREKITDTRWRMFTREAIVKKNDSLDVGLIADESLGNSKAFRGELVEQEQELAMAAEAEVKYKAAQKSSWTIYLVIKMPLKG
jgi:hypothetical protein